MKFLRKQPQMKVKNDHILHIKVTSVDNHPLTPYNSSKKYVLTISKKEQCARPIINTEDFISAFVNRLILKHNLDTG